MSPDSPVKPKSTVSFSIFLAVALLSAAVLGFEVALSRVFAVVLRYQFAFLIVSLALCGLGLGGLWANLRPKTSLENAALGWGVAVCASLALILRGVFALVPQHYWLAAIIVLIPFCFAGAFLSLAFGRFKAEGGRLYAFDLAGAALAAAGSVALMQLIGAINACLFFGFLGALAGVLVSGKRAFPAMVCAILLGAIPLNLTKSQPWSVQPIPPDFQKVPDAEARQKALKTGQAPDVRVSDADWEEALKAGHMPDALSLADRGITQPLFTELGAQNEAARHLAALQKAGKIPKGLRLPVTRVIDTRWNAFARTDVVEDPDAGPDSRLIYTNGNVPTNMLRWNGDEARLPSMASFAISDWTFQNAEVKDQSVFSIGPGGGLDALLALRYGAKSFDGAEINPSIVGLMNETAPIDYRKWNGGIYRNPKVHVRTAEGRDAVREAKGRYRLVFSALTKTATAGQGAALLESFIYTREAFNDYLNALDDGGSMAIVGDTLPLLARLTATGVDHFKRAGQTERQAGEHIAVVFDPQQRGPYEWVLLIKKTPFSPAQTLGMAQSARARQLFPLWIPGQATSDADYPFGSLLSGALSLDAFVASGRIVSPRQEIPLDFSPCSDDRPFVLDLGLSPLSLFQSSPSLSWMLGLSLASTLGLAGILSFTGRNRARLEDAATPEANASARRASARDALGPLLFGCLGVGFMLIEVPLIQKLALPLGYPTLSLSVILFSILLGGGAGALFSQKFEGERLRRHALICALGVVFVSLVFGFSSDVAGRALLSLPLVLRCVAVAALLLPLGFLLGTPFPSGLRLLARDERGVALAWALNGTASVLGSIGAAVGAKMLGFSLVMAMGALVYVVVAGVFAVRREV